MAATADDLQREFGNSPSLRNLVDFIRGPQGQFQRATFELLKTNPPAFGAEHLAQSAAITNYLEKFPALRAQRDKLFLQVVDQIGNVKGAEADRQQIFWPPAWF